MVRLEGIREDIEGRQLDGMRGRQTTENVVDCEAPVHVFFFFLSKVSATCMLGGLPLLFLNLTHSCLIALTVAFCCSFTFIFNIPYGIVIEQHFDHQ